MSVEPVVCWQNGCKCLGSRVTCHRQRHAIQGCLASAAELAGTELIGVIHPTFDCPVVFLETLLVYWIAFAAAAAEIGIPVSVPSSITDSLAYGDICLLALDIDR
ncbi:TPA: hypothetical protein ACH3X1_007422 [Trebouxia sp. C0004]